MARRWHLPGPSICRCMASRKGASSTATITTTATCRCMRSAADTCWRVTCVRATAMRGAAQLGHPGATGAGVALAVAKGENRVSRRQRLLPLEDVALVRAPRGEVPGGDRPATAGCWRWRPPGRDRPNSSPLRRAGNSARLRHQQLWRTVAVRLDSS